MKTRTKALLLFLGAILLVVSTVFATMAYLKSTSDVVTNTFTVGKVEISLDEALVDVYGVPVTDDKGVSTNERIPNANKPTVTGNEYKLIPGHTYTKDPTVTVAAGSEAAYVRMIVTITDLADVKTAFGTVNVEGTNYFLPQNFVEGWDSNVWLTTNVITEEDNTATYEFRYYEIVDAREDAKTLDALFDAIVVPDDVENEQLAKLTDMKIQVVAHAIQADGFASADAAWDAWDSN